MSTVLWTVLATFGIFIGYAILMAWGRSRYEDGARDGARHAPRGLHEQMDAYRRMVEAYQAQSFKWYREVIALNKAQRRLRRQLARWKDEHGKAPKQIQAKAPHEAGKQAASGEAGKPRLEV